ncbi:hypothetical protein SCACP_17250 [Sporomusa carbonis]|uniref:AAA family ATPase n=1 Tax=Sporomusa carbonis TaxID=3076075 RepID=UPI003A69E1F2
MSNKINMINFVANQGKERYKHFIIHGPALSGKTQMAKKLADKLNATYIDLLADFINDSKIKNSIDIFEPQDLKKYLRTKSDANSFIIVDNMDFLINAWDDSQLGNFLKFVARDENKATYCFILQGNKAILQADFASSQGQKRVFSIYDVE